MTFCAYGKDTFYIVRVLGKERCRKTWRVGEEMCACPRDKVIETYVGVRTLQERGVLMCSCVGVWGRERLLYVCVCGGGRGVDFR